MWGIKGVYSLKKKLELDKKYLHRLWEMKISYISWNIVLYIY